MMKHFGTQSGVRRGCYPATVCLSEKANVLAPYRGDFHVRFGSLADIQHRNRHVRFTPPEATFNASLWDVR